MSTSQWCFDGFRLDLANTCLWRGDEAVALPPKVFDMLHYLVTHPNRLVTKDELLNTVWSQTAVSEAAVRVAIGALRKALDDTAQLPRFIATVPRRGYRFLASVTVIDLPETGRDDAPLQHAEPTPPRQGTAPSAPNVFVPQEGPEAWRCAVCQHLQSRTARFCMVCGAPGTDICVVCGQVVSLAAVFCPGCGHELGALPAVEPPRHLGAALNPTHPAPSPYTPRTSIGEPMLDTVQKRAPLRYTPMALATKIRTSRAAPEGERKLVTVLLADITDALELIRSLDPEAAQQFLDPALHAMMDAVHRYEGTVYQVLGDGIMALFGAPIAREDHVIRACYAALALQAALRDYAEEVHRTHGLAIQYRISLHAGEVVVRTRRNDLSMEYSAVGYTTYLAAYMKQLAPPGAILLTAVTARLVEGLVQVKALGPVSVKGLEMPIEMCELLGASDMRRRLQTARARGLTRFVGRQTELAILHAVLAQAGAGHGQVVAVVGEAGVGKSRLLDEFIQTVQTQGWLVLESAAMAYGQATPYFPVLDLLRRYCHVEERDHPRIIRDKVTAQILTLDAALAETLPALLALLDALPEDNPFLQLDAPQRRQHTLTALKRVLLRQTQEHSLLLVCEDLHWLDTETQALIESLSESLPTARLFLLVNYRPDYRHSWGSKTYYTQLRLDPLSPSIADAFLRALLGDDQSLTPFIQLLIQRTEGNPFFLEENVRALVETGALVGVPGAYHVAHAAPTLQIPATVQTVLAARIDRLPPAEKRLLQTAAVIGMEVPLSLLQAVVDLPAEVFRLGLMHLQDAEFLYDVSLLPEPAYTFKHALTQEVAYGGLLQERRRGIHATIVTALEELARDRRAEQVERLAHHALRGEVWDKAFAYCQQAGEKAMVRSASRHALGYFEQALSILLHLPETRATREQAIDLRLVLRAVLRPLGDVGRILVLLREAEVLATTLDDPHRLGQVTGFLAIQYRMTGAYDQAIAAAQRTLAFATTGRDVVLYELAQHALGTTYWVQGDYRRTIDSFSQSVASFDEARRYESYGQLFLPAVNARSMLAASYAELGTFAEGMACGEEGLQIAETVAHPASLMLASWGLGMLSLRQGDLRRALPQLERALSLCQDADLPVYFPRMAAALGAAYTLSGRGADAVLLLTRAMVQATALEVVGFEALCPLALGDALVLAGRVTEAQALAERALTLARTNQERDQQAYAFRLLGEIARQCGPLEHVLADAHYRQALAQAEDLGMRPLQAHCHLGLGRLYAVTSQWEQSRTALAAAITLYRDMEMAFWLPQAEAVLAQVEGQ